MFLFLQAETEDGVYITSLIGGIDQGRVII